MTKMNRWTKMKSLKCKLFFMRYGFLELNKDCVEINDGLT